MIVYNVTTRVRWGILEAWLPWQLEEQLPAILSTGCFDSHRLFRLLGQDEEEGPTFITQFHTSGLERYQQFMTEYAPALQQSGWARWGDGFIAFQTIMESI
jgi:Domain of unknown function (DUF4286)